MEFVGLCFTLLISTLIERPRGKRSLLQPERLQFANWKITILKFGERYTYSHPQMEQ